MVCPNFLLTYVPNPDPRLFRQNVTRSMMEIQEAAASSSVPLRGVRLGQISLNGELANRESFHLFLLIAASLYKPDSPATSFHTCVVSSLADSLRATLGPCLRTACALLGRCLVEGNRSKRHIEYCGKKSTEDETCHSRFPTNVCLSAFRHFTGSGTCSNRISTATRASGPCRVLLRSSRPTSAQPVPR